jgi:hypothetical protein
MNIVQVNVNAVEVKPETLQELSEEQFNSLARQVDAQAKEIRGCVDYTLGKFLQEGRRRHKADIAFGEWRKKWMPNVHKDHVSALMRVVKYEGTAIGTLPLTVQMEVAKKPEAVQQEIAKRVEQGERPTQAEVRSGVNPAPPITPPKTIEDPQRVMDRKMWNEFKERNACSNLRTPINEFAKREFSPHPDHSLRNDILAYEVLGLPIGLRPEIYQMVVRGYLSKYHPDRNEDPNSAKISSLINKSKEILNVK